MGDELSQFEGADVSGTTSHINGTVGLTYVNIPASPGDKIVDLAIHNLSTGVNNLEVSFDGGTNFWTVLAGQKDGWSLKSKPTQFKLRGTTASVNYQVLLNRDAG